MVLAFRGFPKARGMLVLGAQLRTIQEQMLLTKAASEVALSRVFIRKHSECD